ncbi:hypothetical protein [Bradyrhizobium sp. LB12.1]|uniref:hypothetical protein n=1 Tax=Bradyrhizobium sp. LB12.1 TaxID=3156327 RepID=UPI00339812FA
MQIPLSSNVERFKLLLGIVAQLVVCCLVLVVDAWKDSSSHVFFDPGRIGLLMGFALCFSTVGLLFLLAKFSFGYLISYNIYLMILGFLWINQFTDLNYDHYEAALSAVASGIAFIVPAMFLRVRIPRVWTVSEFAFSRAVSVALILVAIVLSIVSFYNFRLLGLESAEGARESLHFPAALRYAMGATASAILPFAFAYLVVRKCYFRAMLAVALLALFYPVTLTKTALFLPLWVVFLALLTRVVETRLAVVLSCLLPMTVGLISVLYPHNSFYFFVLAHRMYVMPANALAFYNDFFWSNPITNFCQINIVKQFVGCAYSELGVVFKGVYEHGNYNASLFATEGIASVGVRLAPISCFVCGLLVAAISSAGDRLQGRLVLISSALFPALFLNVPLSVIMVTHGALVLFLIWCVAPDDLDREST